MMNDKGTIQTMKDICALSSQLCVQISILNSKAEDLKKLATTEEIVIFDACLEKLNKVFVLLM